jgi:hypothetical protein
MTYTYDYWSDFENASITPQDGDIAIISSVSVLQYVADKWIEISIVPATALQVVQNAELVEENTIIPSSAVQIFKRKGGSALWHGMV